MGDRVRGWSLAWSEEFDGAAGGLADPRTWRMETGGGGWGNGELQCYTEGRGNAFLDGASNLAVVARRTGNPAALRPWAPAGSPSQNTAKSSVHRCGDRVPRVTQCHCSTDRARNPAGWAPHGIPNG